ncbi:MAG: hypothetical protein ACLRM7_04225 [Ruminococcus sp.]
MIGEHIPQNTDSAVKLLEKTVKLKNSNAKRFLALEYISGEHLEQDIERDKEKAVEWFTKSANDGNEYAQAMLDDISKFENVLLANTILSLFVNLSRCIEDDYAQKYKSFKQTADCRLRRMIRQKKLSLGIKEEQAQSYE